ncbi:head-tail connector protein [Wenxinia saemankumensis]|uniref:Phage gp6-like head-tail connector protein n=1 Tax=Wenxinia saemankumensis TaxID=1447782 RepID=A0A1M6GMM6_9RHOB|nr:head-tail connector protein [Wenxinia saemankumensis]SHJ11126.1 phage conserved hypothetical protein, phiE125 gp8 family [Wenxinia saemankumensis]
MNLTETTSIPEASLPVAAFREHLRLGSGFAEDGLQDGLLAGFLRAAMAAIEGRTGKVLLEREYELRVTAWRAGDRVALPLAPVAAVGALIVEDATGAETVVPGARWRLLPDAHEPVIEGRGGPLPAIPPGGAVRIEVLAGFGPDWSDIPADLAQAVLLLAAHYYEYREDTGLVSGCMPFGVAALIERYRVLRLWGRTA